VQALQGAIDEYCRRILRGIGGVLIRLSGRVEEADRRRRIPQTLVRAADQRRRGRRADHARTCACEDRHRSGGSWGRVPRPLARLAGRRRGGQAAGFLDQRAARAKQRHPNLRTPYPKALRGFPRTATRRGAEVLVAFASNSRTSSATRRCWSSSRAGKFRGRACHAGANGRLGSEAEVQT
jgi:hypothetical protein